MADKVIYTAIFGEKDKLKRIEQYEAIDYVLFTDDPEIKSDQFEIRVVPRIFDDPVRDARYYKILAHKCLTSYQYSLWIDANISLDGVDIHELFDTYLHNDDLAVHLHPRRICLYEEAAVCLRIDKDNPVLIESQMKFYKDRGFPENEGLISSGIIFRRNTINTQKFNEAWWHEIQKFSRRDQLSFPYVRKKLDFKHYSIPGHVRLKNVPGFSITPHLKSDYRNW